MHTNDANCQMFLILRRDSQAASISCVHCFDLSLGYLSTFYHCAQCGAWEASTLIMYCCFFSSVFFFFFFFCQGKNMSLRHAESLDSHVVYCRLTKGREVRTVTPGNVNEVQQYHSGNTGRIPKQRGRGREWAELRGGEKDKEEEILRGSERRRQWHASPSILIAKPFLTGWEEKVARGHRGSILIEGALIFRRGHVCLY